MAAAAGAAAGKATGGSQVPTGGGNAAGTGSGAKSASGGAGNAPPSRGSGGRPPGRPGQTPRRPQGGRQREGAGGRSRDHGAPRGGGEGSELGGDQLKGLGQRQGEDEQQKGAIQELLDEAGRYHPKARLASEAYAQAKKVTNDDSNVALIIAMIMAPIVLLVLVILFAASAIQSLFGGDSGMDGSRLPDAAQPFLPIYMDAADAYGVSPYLLMAVHEDETTYSSNAPGVRTGVNFAGCCAGPMQFSVERATTPEGGGRGGTWEAYRSASQDRDVVHLPRPASYPGRFAGGTYATPNIYDSYDAIYAAAKYLSKLGAGKELDGRTLKALLSYKGTPPFSVPFAKHDFERAKELQSLGAASSAGYTLANVADVVARAASTPTVPDRICTFMGYHGPCGKVDKQTGIAYPPASAPLPVRAMYAAANEIHTRPYLLKHFATHIGNRTYDCSSSTSHVLWGAGMFGKAPTDSGHLAMWGAKGRGQWVTIYANSKHVFMVIAGVRFDTGTYGPRMPPGTGPRWNTLPRPAYSGGAMARRHPPGL